jgi:hypothetical protein
MRVKTNPIIDMDVNDMVTIKKAIRIFDELIEACAVMTVSDEAEIICADNGEVLVTERELYNVVSVLATFDGIFEEAPYLYGDESCGHKVLAVEFQY